MIFLGLPCLVYVREVREDDLQQTGGDVILEDECNGKLAVFADNGECLAVVESRDMALAWARENNFTLQSVH